jgi:hypothetical protein
VFRGKDDEGNDILDLARPKHSLGQSLDSIPHKEEVSPHLGIEARSILKSLETEAAKLGQFEVLTRTDRHYFRARFNYYKLSILRLRGEEREVLEPMLQSFHEKIIQREFELESQDFKPTPFLEAVPKSEPVRAPRPAPSAESKIEPRVEPRFESLPEPDGILSTRSPRGALQQIAQELALVRLALEAEPNRTSQKIIAQAVDRMLETIKEV